MCEDMDGQPAEGFDLDVEAKLRRKSTRGQSDLERWEAIYRLLFPGEVVPSPCKSIASKNLHESNLACFPKLTNYLLSSF